MAYTLPQIVDILAKADRTMYKIGSVAYNDMFNELDESLDYNRDIIYIYKVAVEYADNFYVGTDKLDAVVERLGAKISIYNYGSLAPIYVDVSAQINQVLNTLYVLKTTALDLGAGLTGDTDFSQSQIDIDIDYTYLNSLYVQLTRTLTINGVTFDLSQNRTWNVGTVTSVAAITLGTAGTDLSSSVATGTTTPVITLNVPSASASNRGVLTSADWTAFNAKQNAITLTTTGSSGASTLIGSTLNIPNYGSALSGYLPLSGGTMTGNINWAQTDRGITWAFNTDGAYIKFYNTADGDTDSRLEFATLDNDNEYFRWGHVSSGGSFYESMRLKPVGSGNSELIVTGKIIKSGGTTSQFLKANGDVDSTSYQPSITLTTTGTSGAATLIGSTLNIPQYVGVVTSVFGRTGAVVATEGDYTLTQLGDVTITSPTNGQVLKYNGTTWVNNTDTDTGLTSVGLSMPVAFSVANSPLTSNGTMVHRLITISMVVLIKELLEVTLTTK